MVTVSPLKRALSIDPNEPLHYKRIWVAKDLREMKLSLEDQMEL